MDTDIYLFDTASVLTCLYLALNHIKKELKCGLLVSLFIRKKSQNIAIYGAYRANRLFVVGRYAVVVGRLRANKHFSSETRQISAGGKAYRLQSLWGVSNTHKMH